MAGCYCIGNTGISNFIPRVFHPASKFFGAKLYEVLALISFHSVFDIVIHFFQRRERERERKSEYATYFRDLYDLFSEHVLFKLRLVKLGPIRLIFGTCLIFRSRLVIGETRCEKVATNFFIFFFDHLLPTDSPGVQNLII